MNKAIVSETEPRQTWQQLADEHAQLDILERDDRITDLERDVMTYRALACAALENVAQLTQRNRQLARRIDQLNGQLRDVLAAPCLDCQRAQRSRPRDSRRSMAPGGCVVREFPARLEAGA